MAQGRRDRARTLSRRGVIASSGGALALAALACRGSSSPTARSSAGSSSTAIKQGGTLARSQTQKLDAVLDPHPLQPVYTSFYALFYQSLLQLNPRTAALEPQLSPKWEQPSQTEYVFHLQPGVKFHNKPPANGREMTAEDVVFSLNRVRTNDPRFQNRLLLTSMDKAEAIDKSTIAITTKQPDVSILDESSRARRLRCSRRRWSTRPASLATADTVVGTGAFMLSQTSRISAPTLTEIPTTGRPGLPYLDSVRTRVYNDPEAAHAAFTSGQIQVGANVLPGPDAKQAFDEQKGKNYVAEWYKDVSSRQCSPICSESRSTIPELAGPCGS